jgi:S-DNA-T family DNA segregation ATPase FtsK/SpoIIIE
VKQATTKTTNKSPMPSQISHRLREGVFIIIAALAIFLMMSLITYHPLDPGWSRAGFTRHIANAGGRAGAWMADFFLYLFGYLAYIFPVMLGYGAWLGYRGAREEKSRHLLMLSSFGFILVLFAGVGLANLYLPASSAHLPYTAGGILGNLSGYRLARYVNRTGATVVLTAAMLCGITLFTGISWLKLSHLMGKASLWIAQKSKELFATLINKFKQSTDDDADNEDDLDVEDLMMVEAEEKEVMEVKPAKLPKPQPRTELQRIEQAPKIAPKINVAELPAKIEKTEKEIKAPSFAAATQSGLPGVDLLNKKPKSQEKAFSKEYLEARSREVEQRLAEFGVEVHVVEVHPGPVVTRYEMDLAPGVKVSKITNLAKDLARSLSTPSVRVVEVIPGKSLVGLELPNPHREMVVMREVLESEQYQEAHSMLSMVLGKDIAGNPVVVDLAKMPHLLVAGTTGSGKSVGLNVMLLSLLFKATPKDVRLIMVDPKMLELSIYEGIPHLLAPVVTDMKQAANALRWCVAEMDRRYQLMAALGVRNLAGYNDKIANAEAAGKPLVNPLLPLIPGQEQPPLERLPNIVVLIDEFADMMMVVGKKVEELIARIAQKARAAGIHLILATQRPSVDVITGLIKANIPTRIAFQVSSKIDSRTILDQQGAEQLLGHGDMLYMPPGSGVPIRVHGAFVADQEVHNVVAELKKLGVPNYLSEIVENRSELAEGGNGDFEDAEGEQDPLYDEAVDFVIQSRRVSISSLQRRFKIGYNRSARIVEDMERAGVVSSMDHSGLREVIAPAIQVND